ncbi:TetR/AcrR family transcriptional regulator [Nocardioides daphniae]|nr:TetR/AcrR family transcriptional regulator [Nocardioides daphniae]
MSTRGSARADGRRNREAILKAAAEAMLDNPQASIAEVAERAGLTRATVYRHYADRDALLQAMARTTAMHLVPTILDEMRPLPWREAMEVLAARAISLSAAYRDVILSIAPHLEQAARVAVHDEPILADITARRLSGEFDPPCSDAWIALCVRTLCLAAIGQLTEPEGDQAQLTRELAITLGGLVDQPRFTP